jgi:hypothetical protein
LLIEPKVLISQKRSGGLIDMKKKNKTALFVIVLFILATLLLLAASTLSENIFVVYTSWGNYTLSLEDGLEKLNDGDSIGLPPSIDRSIQGGGEMLFFNKSIIKIYIPEPRRTILAHLIFYRDLLAERGNFLLGKF